MQYLTNEQKLVVEHRLSKGYKLFGKTKSLLNGLDAFIVNKGNHLMVINSLGYDEHFQGKTWRIYE